MSRVIGEQFEGDENKGVGQMDETGQGGVGSEVQRWANVRMIVVYPMAFALSAMVYFFVAHYIVSMLLGGGCSGVFWT